MVQIVSAASVPSSGFLDPTAAPDRVSIAGSKPLGYEQITNLNTVKALDPPQGATYAVIDAETQNVRWRDDGVDPTASVGKRLIKDAGDLVYDGDLTTIRFIETSASAKLNVSYYGVDNA